MTVCRHPSSHNHTTSDGSEIQVRVAPRSMGNSYEEYPPPH